MIGITGNSNICYEDGLWFLPAFFMGSRHRTIFLLSVFFIIPGSIRCQCAGTTFFKERINAIYTSTSKKTELQLAELLQLQKQLITCHLIKDSAYMFLLQKIGVLYYKQGNYRDAISVTKKSIGVASECTGNRSCNTLALVHNYSNLTYYYSETGQLDDKYAAIDSCIFYALKGGSGFDMAISALIDKTDYLFNKGDYSLCSKDAKLGEDITQQYYHGNDSIQYIVSFVMKQANALYYSKKFSTAKRLLENKILQFDQSGDRQESYAFFSLLGLINRDEKNHAKALDYFLKAYKASSAIRYNKGCAQNLASIGILYARHFNQPGKGLKYCAEALNYADATDSLFILQQTGNIYVIKKMYARAQYFFQQAFNTVQPGMNETTLLQNEFEFPGFNLLQNLSDLTTDKGDACLQQYYDSKNSHYLKAALGIYKKADRFLAKIKTEQQLPLSSNLVWRTTARNLYEHAIEACYANKNIEDAFYFFEKSRAILLNDQINEQRWMADKDIAKLSVLKKTIIELERSLTSIPAGSAAYLVNQKKLYSGNHDLAVSIQKIKNNNPVFYQNYLDTIFMSVVQLKKNILHNSKSLVEIFSGENAVYVLTISPRGQMLTKINKQLYDSLVNTFNSHLTNPERLNKNFPVFLSAARQLFLLVFQNNVPPDGSVIISPDGLSYPFEALVLNNQERQPDYFINHYPTSYTYSVKYLTNRFAANTNNNNSVLGIAPVQYKNHSGLAELNGSDHSLTTINNYFSNGKNYLLKQATRNNFLQEFPQYNIIQLYTHAADSSIDNDPVIYFEDSALYLSDLIPDRKPVTQLVVLSACETATGTHYQGEGIFSFNRGFAAMGIPAAISNLWSVDNESTYRITENFYRYLSQGLPTDVALQKAKLEFISNSSSSEKKLPYFWAGSILTGKVDIIKGDPGLSWKGLTIAGLFFLCIEWLVKIFFLKNGKDKLAVSGG